MKVAGVDACKAGWVIASLNDAPGGTTASIEVAENFAVVHERTKDYDFVAVDVPIGLSDKLPRECDSAARSLLGRLASSVFSAPVRSVLSCVTQKDADQVSRTVAGVGISAQTFAIVPVIREVDVLMTPKLQGRIFEVHPELCFQQALNGGASLDYGKRSAIGSLRRLRLLEAVGIDAQVIVKSWETSARPRVEGKAGLDDVLDALAAAWTARRRAQGVAVNVTDVTQRDARGLLMQMTW